MFRDDTLSEHEAPLVQNLFDRIVEADRGSLASDTDMAKYLLDTWQRAAETVMRPLKTRTQLEAELERLRPSSPFDIGD